MKAIVFFSGGIDSTVLLWEVLKRPWIYGIDDGPVGLVTYHGKDGDKKKKKQLDAILNKAPGTFEWFPAECPLEDTTTKPISARGFNTLEVTMVGTQADMDAMPYTHGLHLWLVSRAMNIAWHKGTRNEKQPLPMMFGFQFDSHSWQYMDAGTSSPNDTSPESLAALNQYIKVIGDGHSQVVAPFLDRRMDRYDIVRHGLDLGVPLRLTSSCIQGWKVDCGLCGQCMKRQRAFKALGVKDG